MTRLARPFAVALAALAPAVFAASALAAAEHKPYTPLAAAVGKPLKAPPDLVAAAEAVRAAAAAGDRDAVYAGIADDVIFVDTGITPTVPRKAEKRSFDGAEAALEAIGRAFTEGEPVGPGGRPLDMKDARIATALTRIAEDLKAPRWASDPLVPGGHCTRAGARWDAAAAAKAKFETQAVFVLEATDARASPSAGAKSVTRLAPSRLYVDGGAGEAGWNRVTLPDGKTGWVAPGRALPAQAWGFCFLPNVEGGWLLAAVVSALN